MGTNDTDATSRCPFCDIAAGRGPRWVVYEDERTIAFLPKAPEAFGHTLIAPRAHVTGLFDASPALLQATMATVQRVSRHYQDVLNAQGMNVLHASGTAAGQSVQHFHMHLLPRFADDGLNAWPSLPAYHQDNDDVLQRLRLRSRQEVGGDEPRDAAGRAASSPDLLDARVATHLEDLERRLFDPAVRRSAARVDALLAADFREFGSSGQAWRRQDVIAGLAKEASVTRTLTDFRAIALGPNAVLVTYRCDCGAPEGTAVSSLRSSMWRCDHGTWRMVFHQGTPCPAL